MSVRACVALVLLAVLVMAQPEYKAAPFLVVTKAVSEYYVVVGNTFDVKVTVTNHGDAPAFDVSIVDSQGSEPAKKHSVEKLETGESAFLNYTTVAKALGDLDISRAEVTYTLSVGDSNVLKATSNTIREEEAYFLGETKGDAITNRGTITIVTSEQYDRLHTKYIKETIGYLFVGAISVLFPFFMYRTKQNQVDQLIRQAKKK